MHCDMLKDDLYINGYSQGFLPIFKGQRKLHFEQMLNIRYVP